MVFRLVFPRLRCLFVVLAGLAVIALLGCSGGKPPETVRDQPARGAASAPPSASQVAKSDSTPKATPPAPLAAKPDSTAAAPAPGTTGGPATADTAPGAKDHATVPATKPAATDKVAAAPAGAAAGTPAQRPKLDELLAKFVIPPPWLDGVATQYDTSKPWKDARVEIRRLLGLGRPETHREAIKLTWLYLQKGDIGDGHEYPMYTFLGGEPVWSVRAHEQFLAKPHEYSPTHAYLSLASLYSQFGEFDKAKAMLDTAMKDLPPPPWDVLRKADMLDAYGDLYAAWGKTEEAKRSYTEAAALYPTARPPHGGHLLPRRADQVQSKLDLLTFRSVATAGLKDGQYRGKALGYAGDIDVTVVVREGKIADIQLKHEEKIDQHACVLIPQRIINAQSLQVDGISGATVTKEAIVHGVYRCLQRARLR